MTRNDGPARPERFGVVRARVTRGTLCHHGVTFGVRTGAGPRSRQAPGRSGEREARPGEQHGVVLASEVRLTGPTPPRTRSPKGPWIRSRESATYVARMVTVQTASGRVAGVNRNGVNQSRYKG